MKRLVDYLKKEKFTSYVGTCLVTLQLHDNVIILSCNGDKYLVGADNSSPEYEIQDILYDNYGTEIRFCDECGKPYDEGYMAGDGEYYCCEECFEPMMNRDYGEGKWRGIDEEGRYGGLYEYLDGDKWDDTGLFYTEWN